MTVLVIRITETVIPMTKMVIRITEMVIGIAVLVIPIIKTAFASTFWVITKAVS